MSSDKQVIQQDYEVSCLDLGEEKVLYISLPFKGCTVIPKCLFCGIRDAANKALCIDDEFGAEVLGKTDEFLNQYNPDSVVLYTGGNILRPAEMYQETIAQDIPDLISSHSTCNAYELEVRPDDIVQLQAIIIKIKANLGQKKLRVRTGIEYYDDELLERHRKGVNIAQIQEAVNLLNAENIEWNGYALLGGLDMTKEEAREAAIKTGKFMLDNNAFRISINGMFVTNKTHQSFGERIYIPDYSDLIYVLTELCKYRDTIKNKTIIKVGFEEEDIKNVFKLPYSDQENVENKLREFNKTQNIKDLPGAP
ncbi:hypothetical protein ACFLZH_05530 [Patescibacteria group bacterium]